MNAFQKSGIAMVLVLLALFPLAGFAEGQQAGAWPSDNVTVIVPAATGSGIDLMARICTDYLQKKTGKAFIVQNDVTGNGTVAYEKLRHAKPDGLTIMFTQNLFIQYHGGVYDKAPWENFDVAGIAQQFTEGYILVVGAGKGYKTWDDVVKYAKAHPGKMVAGIQHGGMAHMLNEILNSQAGIKMKMVESGSSADKILAILGGHVDIAFVAAPTGNQYVKAGDLVALMTTTPKPSAYNDTWPTSAELGYPDVVNVTVTAFFVPKGTDSEIIKQINNALEGMESDPEVKSLNAKLFAEYKHYTPEEAVKKLKQAESVIIRGYKIMGKK